MPPKIVKPSKADALRHQRQFSIVETQEWLIGSEIWVPSEDNEILYDKAHVTAISGNNLNCDVNGVSKVFPASECRNVNARVDPLSVHDLAKLTHINDAAVLEFLRIRYMNNEIYTYASQLLIAINPFYAIPGIYEISNLRKYQQSTETMGFPSDLPPHTYAIAQKAVLLFHDKKRNQSCVVSGKKDTEFESGESGSGKTETARQLMQFMASSEQKTDAAGSVQDIILGSNPLLESFGNAKTLRNNNSSRFGRFIKLGIKRGGGITAGEISQYMLELSRIDVQQKGERNYHIFYQLCSHLSSQLSGRCKVRDLKLYRFLNQSGTYTVETVDDAEESREVQSVLRSVMSEDVIEGLYMALSGILLCGNLDYKNVSKRGTDEAAEVSTPVELNDVAELAGVSRDKLELALTVKSTVIGGQVVESALSAKDASAVSHTLAKDIYSAIFDWLVHTINGKIVGPAGGLNDRWVGILDIYGFEYFENNSFEQFLINFANEKLQQFFVQNVFRAEIQEYEAEGIDHSMIVYEDNAAVISILEDRKKSVLALLEEQSLLGTGSSEKFTASCHQAFEKNPLYVKPRGDAREMFGINHTAAPVLYNTTEFVTKNKLRMPNELINLLKSSQNPAVKSAFERVELPDERQMRGKFVGSKFLISMDKLLGVLGTSNAHFIRCIKPNQLKKRHVYTNSDVLGQLHCLSILEAVAIVQKGFAYRALYEEFITDNQVLINLVVGDVTGDPIDVTRIVLERLQVAQDQWQAGKSRIFIRKEGWLQLDQFFKKAMLTIKPLITRIQGIYQSYFLRRGYKDRLFYTIRLQSLLRRYAVVKVEAKKKELVHLVLGCIYLMKFVNIRQRRLEAALTIQKHARRYLVQKKYHPQIQALHRAKLDKALTKWARTFKASRGWRQAVLRNKQRRAVLKIQKIWRGYRARKFTKRYRVWKRLNVAATRIQAMYRGYQSRKSYQFLKRLTPYVITIQKCWRGYKVRCGSHMGPLNQVLAKIRRSRNERQALIRLTSFARTYLVQQRVERIIQVAFVLQAYALSQILRAQMDRIRWAVVTIQSWWRGDRVRRIIREEKYRVSQQADYECDVARLLHKETLQIKKDLKKQRKADNNYKRPPSSHTKLQLIQVSLGVDTPTVYPHGWSNGFLKLRKIAPTSGIESVACGAFHTVILTDAGFVYTYGLNDRGQLGVKNVDGRADPEFPLVVPLRVSIKQVVCGADHSMLLAFEGHVFAWGSNERGQCGTRLLAKVVHSPTLVKFARKKNGHVEYLSAGAFHSAAVSRTGAAWIWGRVDHICLRGVADDIPIPAIISDPEINQAIGSVCRMECGLGCTFILNDFGEVFVFGSHKSPCLGLGPGVSRFYTPTKLSFLNRVVDIRVGVNFVVAVNVDGLVFQWGTVLEWDPCILQATKVTLCEPMKVDKDALDDENAVECAVGWWEAAIRTDQGRVLGWNIFRHCGDSTLIPHVYGFDLIEDCKATRLEMVSCPALTAVLCETESKPVQKTV